MRSSFTSVSVVVLLLALGPLSFGINVALSGGLSANGSFLEEFFPDVYCKLNNTNSTDIISNYCTYKNMRLSFFSSSIHLGCWISSWFAPLIMQASGPEASIFIGAVGSVVVSIASSCSSRNFAMLTSCRILTGFFNGFLLQANSQYISAIAATPQILRGWSYLNHILIKVGAIIADLMNIRSFRESWRLSLGVALPFEVMQCVLAIVVLIRSLIQRSQSSSTNDATTQIHIPESSTASDEIGSGEAASNSYVVQIDVDQITVSVKDDFENTDAVDTTSVNNGHVSKTSSSSQMEEEEPPKLIDELGSGEAASNSNVVQIDVDQITVSVKDDFENTDAVDTTSFNNGHVSKTSSSSQMEEEEEPPKLIDDSDHGGKIDEEDPTTSSTCTTPSHPNGQIDGNNDNVADTASNDDSHKIIILHVEDSNSALEASIHTRLATTPSRTDPKTTKKNGLSRFLLVMIVFISFFQQGTGINTFGPALYRTISNCTSGEALKTEIIFHSFYIVGTVFASYMQVLEKEVWTWRRLLIVGGTTMAISLFALATIMGLGLGDHVVAAFVAVCFYQFSVGLSWGSLGSTVPAELLRLGAEILPSGQYIVPGVSYVFSFLVSQFYLTMLCTLRSGMFWTFGCMGIFMTAFARCLLPDTNNGADLEHIDSAVRSHWFWGRFDPATVVKVEKESMPTMAVMYEERLSDVT